MFGDVPLISLKNINKLINKFKNNKTSGSMIAFQTSNPSGYGRVKTKNNNVDFSLVLRKNKLLSVPADDNVIRFTPPLIITNEEVDKAISIIDKSLKELND